MTNVIFESYLHNIYLESNLIFRPLQARCVVSDALLMNKASLAFIYVSL